MKIIQSENVTWNDFKLKTIIFQIFNDFTILQKLSNYIFYSYIIVNTVA